MQKKISFQPLEQKAKPDVGKMVSPPYHLLSVTLVSHELAKVSGTEGHGRAHAQNMHEQVGSGGEFWKFTRTKNKIRSIKPFFKAF